MIIHNFNATTKPKNVTIFFKFLAMPGEPSGD